MVASGAKIGVTLIVMLHLWKKPIIRIIVALIKRRSKHFDGEV